MDDETRAELENLIDEYVRAEDTISEIKSKGYGDLTLRRAEREKADLAEEIVDLVAVAIFHKHGWGGYDDTE